MKATIGMSQERHDTAESAEPTTKVEEALVEAINLLCGARRCNATACVFPDDFTGGNLTCHMAWMVSPHTTNEKNVA